MKHTILMLGIVAALGACATATEQTAAPPAQPAAQAPAAAAAFSTATTTLGVLMDDPAARAVLERHIPRIIGHPSIGSARAATLRQIAERYAGAIPEETLAAIDRDLAALPANAAN